MKKTRYGVKWIQVPVTSAYIWYDTLEEAEAYCDDVNNKYPEISQWPIKQEIEITEVNGKEKTRVLKVLDLKSRYRHPRARTPDSRPQARRTATKAAGE